MRKLHNYALSLALVGTSITLPFATQASPLFLVGGGMKSCASQNLKHCDRSQIDRLQLAASRTALKLSLAPDRVAHAADPAWWNTAEQAQEAKAVLSKLADKLGTEAISKRDFQDALKDSKRSEDWYYSLSDDQWALLVDRLEVYQTDKYGERLKENVWLEANRDPHTPAIVDALIESAKAQRPADSKAPVQVVVFTTSARDPFEAADFYQGLFAREDTQVTWLPLDASVQAARRDNACGQLDDYRLKIQGNSDRTRIYPRMAAEQQKLCMLPQRGLDVLSKAEVLFINGGDQSLTWQALRHPDGAPTEELKLIKQRFAANQLVVGGTSAGAAVQGSPMIANGSNAYALQHRAKDAPPPRPDCDGSKHCGGMPGDALVYNGLGGLGLLPEGTITDTHFSERGRQVRLTLLTRQLGATYAYGSDENTALVVNGNELSVIGEAGAWLLAFDGKADAITSHYLHQGDSALQSESGFEVNLAGTMTDEHDRQDQPLVTLLESERDDLRRLTNELCHSRQQQALGQLQAGDKSYGVLLTLAENGQFGTGNGRACSYSGLEWKIGEVASE